MSELEKDIGPTMRAVIRASRRITPENAVEVRHLTLQVQDPAFQFMEGQSIGVFVPGPHPFGNAVHMRRYSIANARALPLDEGVDLDLLVRRCFYIDEISGERYPGIASNFLCDAKPGDGIDIGGPYRSPFRMPLDARSNLLMVGTGTGIAPFRAFVQLIYQRRKDWQGEVRIFYGGRTGLDLMYANDEETNLTDYYDQATFKAFKSLAPKPLMSSSQALERGLRDNAEEAWKLIKKTNTYLFLAGLGKVAEVFDKVMAEQAGSQEQWAEAKKQMVDDKRWAELIY